MNSLIPNEFKVNGNLVVQLDRDSLTLTMVLLLIVIIVSLIAWKAFIKTA